MTSKERMLITMRHGIPDRVPVTPDISNMIPARLTGKPFWDLYLYQDPPLWVAYIDAVKQLGIDGMLDYQVVVDFPDEIIPPDPRRGVAIVERTEERLVTRRYCDEGAQRTWAPVCDIYPRYDPPTVNVPIVKVNIPEIPDRWEPVTGVKAWPVGEELFALAYEMMGDHGLVGMVCGTSSVVSSVEGVYQYYDDPDAVRADAQRLLEASRRRMAHIAEMRVRPDYIQCGGSGSLVFQTVEIFRDVSLEIIQSVTQQCREAGIVSHLHSCGPERALVKICAEETALDGIEPLEIPPMGDCHLAELKHAFGDRLVLKGNLHTTEVMLRGSYAEVFHASRQAIADAAMGGGFVLSTGDQCGRDTPLTNIQAMLDAAEQYGRYTSPH